MFSSTWRFKGSLILILSDTIAGLQTPWTMLTLFQVPSTLGRSLNRFPLSLNVEMYCWQKNTGCCNGWWHAYSCSSWSQWQNAYWLQGGCLITGVSLNSCISNQNLLLHLIFWMSKHCNPTGFFLIVLFCFFCCWCFVFKCHKRFYLNCTKLFGIWNLKHNVMLSVLS